MSAREGAGAVTFRAPIDPPLRMRLRRHGRRVDVEVVAYVRSGAADQNEVVLPSGARIVVANSDLYTPRAPRRGRAARR